MRISYGDEAMKIGDTVVRKSYGKDITFKIIDINETEKGLEYVIKGRNLRLIADSPAEDLELVKDSYNSVKDEVLNKRVNKAIKKVISQRNNYYRSESVRMGKSSKKSIRDKELTFGRPGRILHVDGDSEYLNICLKVYQQLGIDAVGRLVVEKTTFRNSENG